MGLYSLALFLPSHAFPLSCRRLSRSHQNRRHSSHFLGRIRPFPALAALFLLLHRAPPTHPPRQGASSFSPVPPDRLKLQSVASPSVGTLIRGRLHCSGTLLAALGYQLSFPALPVSPSVLHALCHGLSPFGIRRRLFFRPFIGGSPYSWTFASLPDNPRVKLLCPVGIALARALPFPTYLRTFRSREGHRSRATSHLQGFVSTSNKGSRRRSVCQVTAN